MLMKACMQDTRSGGPKPHQLKRKLLDRATHAERYGEATFHIYSRHQGHTSSHLSLSAETRLFSLLPRPHGPPYQQHSPTTSPAEAVIVAVAAKASAAAPASQPQLAEMTKATANPLDAGDFAAHPAAAAPRNATPTRTSHSSLPAVASRTTPNPPSSSSDHFTPSQAGQSTPSRRG